MSRSPNIVEGLSSRRIVGFAANQGFVFFLIYRGISRSITFGPLSFNHLDLFVLFVSMMVGFSLVHKVSIAKREILFSQPSLYASAIVMAASSLLCELYLDMAFGMVLLQYGLLGFTSALLFTAWGRTFGRVQTSISVPEVFLGSLLGSVLCFAFVSVNDSYLAALVLRLLPLASVVNIEVPSEEERLHPLSYDESLETVNELSVKILIGTVFFGITGGLIVSATADSLELPNDTYFLGMVFFAAFLLGSLSLLMSEGFGHGAALNKSYRLSVFVMLTGILAAPWFDSLNTIISGKSIVLAGFLGLEVILISLFLVLAQIAAQDPALSFSTGFSFLFAGQMIGVLIGDLTVSFTDSQSSYLISLFAGLCVLLAYVFFFTERDFDNLSEIVEETDTFAETCNEITDKYGLSNRESEVLGWVLRGRSNARIAEELVLSKSTVDTHIRRIYSKVGVHGRQELLDLGEEVSEQFN